MLIYENFHENSQILHSCVWTMQSLKFLSAAQNKIEALPQVSVAGGTLRRKKDANKSLSIMNTVFASFQFSGWRRNLFVFVAVEGS